MKHIIEKLSKSRFNKTSLAYKSAKEAIENPGAIIRTGKSIGNGRFSSSKEWTSDVKMILIEMGVSFTCGNDSPRNGRAGEYIIVTNENL